MEIVYKEHTIKKNDYVRTINGQLDRIKRIQQGEDYNGSFLEIEHYSGIVDLYRYPMISIYPVKYKNNSKNIIDLIEVGDYVNGMRVIATENRGRYNEEKQKDEKVILAENYDEWTENGVISNEDIKSILTHEQFEQNCYKVGVENE